MPLWGFLLKVGMISECHLLLQNVPKEIWINTCLIEGKEAAFLSLYLYSSVWRLVIRKNIVIPLYVSGRNTLFFFYMGNCFHLLCETCRMNTLKLVVLPADGPVSLTFSVEDSFPQFRCRKTAWNYNVDWVS